MFLLNKKKSTKGIPIDLVKDLSSKGLSEPEIVSILRRQGYSASQIEKALTDALKTTISSNSVLEFSEKQNHKQPLFSQNSQQKFSVTEANSLPTLQTIPSPQHFQSAYREFMLPQPQENKQKQSGMPSFSPPTEIESKGFEDVREETSIQYPDLTLEEVIEGIIADKWTSFETMIEELRRKDDDLQRQIIDLRKEIDAVKDAIRKSEERFITKLEEHGEHVTSIEARIGSIERIFKEFIPDLTETMRIVKEIVEKKKENERNM